MVELLETPGSDHHEDLLQNPCERGVKKKEKKRKKRRRALRSMTQRLLLLLINSLRLLLQSNLLKLHEANKELKNSVKIIIIISILFCFLLGMQTSPDCSLFPFLKSKQDVRPHY